MTTHKTAAWDAKARPSAALSRIVYPIGQEHRPKKIGKPVFVQRTEESKQLSFPVQRPLRHAVSMKWFRKTLRSDIRPDQSRRPRSFLGRVSNRVGGGSTITFPAAISTLGTMAAVNGISTVSPLAPP